MNPIKHLSLGLLGSLALAPFAQGQAFGPRHDFYPAPFSPVDVIAEDFDGDGQPDMVCASVDDNTVGWFKNLTGDDFGPIQVISTTSQGASKLAAGDLDGNGTLDLFVGSESGNGIEVYTNPGNAQFSLVGVLDVSGIVIDNVDRIHYLQTVDFQGDGSLDLLVATLDGIGWFEGDGAGGFKPIEWISAAWNGGTAYAEDFDGDGDPDILAVMAWNREVGWFENLGGGAFGPFQFIIDGKSAFANLYAADIDGDGDHDVITSGQGGMVWVENREGVFQTVHPIHPSGTHSDVTAVDVDADGDLDVVASYTIQDNIRVFINTGNGNFPLTSSIINTGTSAPKGIATADLDADGDYEVIATSPEAGMISWQEFTSPDGYGSSKFPQGMGLSWAGLSIVDLDGDGDDDILAGSPYDQPIKWIENSGASQFEFAQFLDGEVWNANDVLTGDLNGDGILDVVAFGTYLKTVYWFEGLGGGAFAPRQDVASTSIWPMAGAVVDFDGDGDSDILGVSLADGEIWWIENLGAGTFSPTTTILAQVIDPADLAMGDLDSDGDLDAVFLRGRDVGFLENIGGGQVAPAVMIHVDPFSAQVPGSEIYLLDKDGDGDLDVLRRLYNSATIVWFENLGNLQFGPESIHSVLPGPVHSMIPADYDGDGDKDLVVNSFNGMFWIENLGGGSYGSPVYQTGQYYSDALAAGDFDQDGLPDLLIARVGTGMISWLENRLDEDCNGNGIFDGKDIVAGTSLDCNGNEIPDECELLIATNDIDNDGQLDDCVQPPLRADIYEMSVNAGGTAAFTLTAPNPGDIYLLLGSASGTTGGLSANGFTLPLQVDPYFNLTVTKIGSPPLGTAFGLLAADGSEGTATSTFSLPPAFSPVLVGLNLHHAFLTANPITGAVTFVSNAVPLALLP